MRQYVPFTAIGVVLLVILSAIAYPPSLWSLLIIIPLAVLGARDYFQTQHSILRNFPIVGHFRYFSEELRPPIYQYFIESETEGVPFNREQRSIVYERAKHVLDTIPFGTKSNVYQVGYEWVNHSLAPVTVAPQDMRVDVGGPACTQPYSASLLNISAMSFGSLSRNAILALSRGAKAGDFAHNTGEGGLSQHHREGGGDLIWQIGTGYFGCRDESGNFCVDKFGESASVAQVKMIEVKLSQGAKPGHGGILPAAKLSKEIAEIRGVPLGKDVVSPPAHSAFSTPRELLEFIHQLRTASGGKPTGFKLCLGKPREFIAICKAMLETGITPDFITVDGGEGGTGAAPLEFSNHVGTPLIEGLIFVQNVLVGFGLRDSIRLFSSGKVITGFGMVKRLALGADACYSARAMMMALGCIQALKCNTNECPVGVATQDKNLQAGLVPSDKSVRVMNFHRETLESVRELMGAMGVSTASELQPWHILRRTSATDIHDYSKIYDFVSPGSFLGDDIPADYRRAIQAASADSFRATEPSS